MMPGVGQHNMGNWGGSSRAGTEVTGYPSSRGPMVFDTFPGNLGTMYRNSAYTTSAGPTVQVPFDTILTDLTNGRLTLGASAAYNVPAPGTFLVTAGFTFFTIPAANDLGVVIGTYQGGQTVFGSYVQSGMAGQPLSAQVSAIIQAGQFQPDNIYLMYQTTYAGVIAIGSSPIYTYMSVMQLG